MRALTEKEQKHYDSLHPLQKLCYVPPKLSFEGCMAVLFEEADKDIARDLAVQMYAENPLMKMLSKIK